MKSIISKPGYVTISLLLAAALGGCDYDHHPHYDHSAATPGPTDNTGGTGGSAGSGGTGGSSGSSGHGYGGGVNIPPSGSSGSGGSAGSPVPNPGCSAVPQSMQLTVSDCSTGQQALLVGFAEDASPDSLDSFSGVVYDTGTAKGSGVKLDHPSADVCGPVLVGAITVGPLTFSSDRSMEYYLIDKSSYDLVFQQNNGHAPSWAEYQSLQGVELVEKIWQCAWGPSCSLTVAPPAGTVKRLQATGPSANTDQSLCDWTIFVARSL